MLPCLLLPLTCTVKLVDSFERRRTSAKAMVKPFSMLSLKLQNRTSMWLGTNCSTAQSEDKESFRPSLKTKVYHRLFKCWLQVERSFTCVDLIFAVWCCPVGRHRQEAAPRPSQSIDDRYGCVHDWTRHHPKHKPWWGVHNLHRQSRNIWQRQNHSLHSFIHS